ncbi:hypothetical protein QJS64_07740 [Paraclostridium bifermentans]|uniref:Bacteriocin n=1 Tax=Paraclostridium bifermentans TaxID=1490 RepID=A0ABY8R6J8_PARBF|nr:hypothetical protein QJS64_07740 [Paraclostridium bifermentans]
MMKNMELKLPNSYVEINSNEMEYIEGGLGAPNWLVAGAISTAISAASGGTLGAGSVALKAMAKKYGKRAAATMFSKNLKKSLMRKGIAAGVAGNIAGAAAGAFEVMMWGADPGGSFTKWYDARDPRPKNGWCDIS